MAKSKLKAMAAAGDPWAVATLAKARAQGRAAAANGRAIQRGLAAPKPVDPAFAEAMRDARDIRQWTDGPNPSSWRVYRLAQALFNDRRAVS
jgi:hypothetical protein